MIVDLSHKFFILTSLKNSDNFFSASRFLGRVKILKDFETTPELKVQLRSSNYVKLGVYQFVELGVSRMKQKETHGI